MYHIEFQIGGTNDRKHLNVWHGVNLISIRDGLITRTIHSPFRAALQPFSILAGEKVEYFYLQSSLSNSEKAKWEVVGSFFTTSIPNIVVAVYSGVGLQGVKHRVTGRGLGTRAKSCESLPWSLHSLLFCMCVCVCEKARTQRHHSLHLCCMHI